MKSMRFAVLGSAHPHVFGFAENMVHAGGVLAGVYDDGTENAKNLADAYGAPLFASPEELLLQDVEAAGSFAQNDARVDAVRLCAKHGVHVMCDKPLIVDEAGLRILEEVTAAGRIEIGAMFTVRFMPAVRALKRVLDSGELGELVNVDIFNPHKLTPEKRPAWHFSRAQSGGIAVDLLTHSVDLFHWLTGRAPFAAGSCTVIKSMLPGHPEFEDLASAMVSTPGGVGGYFRVDWHIPDAHWNWGDLRIFVVGTKGHAEVRATGDPLNRREELIVYSPETGTESRPLEACTDNEVTDFLARIAGRAHCITAEDVLFTCRETLALDRGAIRYDRTGASGTGKDEGRM